MFHPLIGNRLTKTVFVVWWIVVAAIHSTTIYFFYEIPIQIAIVDSILWNTLFAILSLGLWFWVRISDIETAKPISIVINHIGAAVVSIIALVSLHRFLSVIIFPDENDYKLFLESSIPGRVITATLFYILVVLVYYLIIYIHNFRDKVSREAELKALIKDAELSWLKLQVNPHFLFNSLNSVSSLTMTSPEKAQDMITRLSELLRYSLSQSPDSMVALKDEINNCIKYLEIEKVRFGSRLDYSINNPTELMNISVPSMILQPLFENAIKHSVAQSTETSTINAEVSKDSFGIIITVSNTLPDGPSSTRGTGLGLENIKRRMHLIYGMSNLLTVNKSETVFSVVIRIPFNK
jgi:LytS/YehU family sensor histidine kinase